MGWRNGEAKESAGDCLSSSPYRERILPNTTPELAPILLIVAIFYAEFFEEVICAFYLPKCVSLRAHSVEIATTFFLDCKPHNQFPNDVDRFHIKK